MTPNSFANRCSATWYSRVPDLVELMGLLNTFNEKKTVLQILFLLLMVGNISQGISRAENLELENRLNDAKQVITEMLQAPDGGIPHDLLNRSKAIIIFP
jgi:hypothetical protein